VIAGLEAVVSHYIPAMQTKRIGHPKQQQWTSMASLQITHPSTADALHQTRELHCNDKYISGRRAWRGVTKITSVDTAEYHLR
jgi:hypothetical protein